MSKPGPRGSAARAVSSVCDRGRSLNDVLPPAQAGLADPRDRALLQELVYGTLRWRPRLKKLTSLLLRKPFKARDAEVGALLQLALYELLHGVHPDYAVVDQAVAAARELDRPWAAPVVNAALRRFTRERDELLARVDEDDEARWAHPAWLLQTWRSDWPEQWEQIARTGNTRPPLWLRVNTRKISVAEYRARLDETGLDSEISSASPAALRLERPVPVSELPGFDAGQVSVQDLSAQRVAALLDAGNGQRVLDVCAAPGGKSAHLLESVDALELLAVDVDADRLERARENFARLGLKATAVAGDACRPGDWWDGQAFDRILVDAPCTGAGVIRRHPDIKCLRQAGDVTEMAARQQAILAAVWPLLVSGGMLLYTTCSVLREENDGVIAAFTAQRTDVSTDWEAEWGWPCRSGRQLLPGDDDGDGFYYARLKKTA